jgi:DNA-binding NtrC family response regulator
MPNKPKVLLVDDDPGLLRLLGIRLNAIGYDVDTVDSGERALGRLPVFQPQVVITDLRMDGMDGMALFEVIHEQQPTLPVIILTAHGTIPDAVEATHRGIFGYLTKPFDSKELLECVAKALRVSGEPQVEDVVARDDEWRHGIITRSAEMEALLRRARLVARSEASILIQSESGTGKELLAKAIHKGSMRTEKPFVAVNCTAIPESLLESELFGHGKGSFTGATREHKGLFQTAQGGTLFLDEIGDLSPAVQCKLLRFLQEREFTRVGGGSSIKVDVRIIAATNKNLEELVKDRTFRQDLYYRVNVISLYLPPLRERREDIPLLAEHFLRARLEDEDRPPQSFSKEAMDILTQYHWPGNVRELENAVERAMVWSRGATIVPEHFPASLRADSRTECLRDQTLAGRLSLEQAVREFEREMILDALKRTNYVQTQASALLGISRRMLKYRMDILGITRDLVLGTGEPPAEREQEPEQSEDGITVT